MRCEDYDGATIWYQKGNYLLVLQGYIVAQNTNYSSQSEAVLLTFILKWTFREYWHLRYPQYYNDHTKSI